MAVTYTTVITLKPGAAAAFMALLTPVLDAMRHEATFINAVLHQDGGDPDRFMLYETWANPRDLEEVQMGRAYRTACWQGLPELLREPREVAAWQPLRTDFRTAIEPAG
ncbi:putative quinol monooxygenase [Phreatobacter stygius]|uniref:Antibiotic biosynthesis monooxygenase n=1 Tax=Phreatobacter stygius TaxID=1940610 RepID=A0A4D7AWN2_9HYPH|nr:putative quinol monooxygenase [Phreatobacter stygius]QCI63915.1 antibiotic biosynthesis monooxygenase [Phreatobacter stygius]